MKSISISALREILYDMNTGIFSEDFQPNIKLYRDEENELEIELRTEKCYGEWKLDAMITDCNGDEHNIDEGQWYKLYQALMGDVEWREKEARSEAEHIKHLWRTAYA